MLQMLTNSFSKIVDRFRGGVITESNMEAAISDIMDALIDADVAFPVVENFVSNVRKNIIGQQVIKSVSPGQQVIKIIHEELVEVLGEGGELDLKGHPCNILMCGLQGSGKTTTTAKLSAYLKSKGKMVLLVSLDTYRPAAQEQLTILAQQVGVDCLEIVLGESPLQIVERALKQINYDVVIYDTAGRLHIDEEMLSELDNIKNMISPSEVLLVVDAMTGNDATNIAIAFNDRFDLTGVILAKMDADTKGGAALSIRYTINKPIKFLGIGEKHSMLEEFSAEKIASRILDMGDIVSLVKHAQETIDQEELAKATERAQKGKFNLDDYLFQLRSLKKMGGMGNVLKFIPGAAKLMDRTNVSGDLFAKQEAIICSMTKEEKRYPEELNASRKRRIALGSGTSIQDVNRLLKQFAQISSVMKKVGKMDSGMIDRIKKLFG